MGGLNFLDPGRILDFVDPRRGPLTIQDSDVMATFKALHDSAAPQAGGRLDCSYRSSLVLKADFDAASRNAVVKILFFREVRGEDGVEGAAGDDGYITESDPITLTATTQEDDATVARFPTPYRYVACEGFSKFRVKLESISGGNVNIYVGTAQ